MNRHFLLIFGAVLVGSDSTSRAAEPEKITIRGETFQVWPREDLVKRGFDVREVPRDENAAWIYLDAINRYVELPKELEEVFDYAVTKTWPADQTALTEYMKLPANREAIDLFHKASAMERCQMPTVGDPDGSIIGMLLPNLTNFRFLSRLMVADARRLVAEEKYDEALRNIWAVMRAGDHVAQGATVIEALVGIAMWTAANQSLIDLVLRYDHSASWLKGVQKDLAARGDQLPGVKRAFRSERAYGLGLVDELCSRPLLLLPNLAGVDGGAFSRLAPPADDGWGELEFRIGQLIFPDQTIKKHMRSFYDAVDRRAEAGWRTSTTDGFDEEKYLNEKVPKWDVVSRTMLPSFSRSAIVAENAKARFAAARAVVALKLFAVENEDRWPGSLAEISEKPEVEFADPFTGKPLIYRRTNEGWILYSIAGNLKDDGGRVGKRYDSLDIVDTYPVQRIEPFGSTSDQEE